MEKPRKKSRAREQEEGSRGRKTRGGVKQGRCSYEKLQSCIFHERVKIKKKLAATKTATKTAFSKKKDCYRCGYRPDL